MDARGIAAFLIVATGFAFLPALGAPPYFESLLYLVFFWIALATSWNLLSGFSGYFSFGHGAFYGAGVYATAVFAARYDVPFVWTLVIAGLIAALLGVAVGALVFRLRRLRGELFALLTLAVSFIVASIVLNTSIDGGPGIFLSGVPVPKIYESAGSMLYVFSVAIAFASLMTARAVQYSSLGRGLFAIRDDEDVAEVTGVPTFRFKLAALALSCFLAGIAGGIHAMFVTYVTVAETFSITVPLFVILMSVLGGTGHWLGPAIGATFITILSYAFVSGESAVASRAIIGLILILVILFLPRGAMGFATARWRLFQPKLPQGLDDAAHKQRKTLTRPIAVSLPADGGALLSCDDVHLSFHGVKALDDVSLDVREGEILGLVGPNGSGKSTLVNAISGYYRPQSGRILFAGEDLIRREAHRIARLGVARTYQIPRPFPSLSVLENVALAATFGAAALERKAAYREAGHWLEFVGLAERSGALPSELNLHQRKFLELARALACRPRLVLLDEVLSGLTPAEIKSALALVRRIREGGTTIVFIEHNMRAVLELVDRLIVLNYGKVIAQGNPKLVLQQQDVVMAYLGTVHA
jgi:branched-chain amino acid transport system permease protein